MSQPARLSLPRMESLSGCMHPGDVQGQPPQQCEVGRSMVSAVALTVLVHRHVQHPVQGVFDGPVRTHGTGEAFR